VTDKPVQLSVPPGTSRHLRITIDVVRPSARPPRGGIILGAGITDVAIPGVSYHPQMRVPNDEASTFSRPSSRTPVVVFSRPLANANLLLGLLDTDDPVMGRLFSLPKAMDATITGTAVSSHGASLEQVIEFLNPQPPNSLQAMASSWLAQLPRFRPSNLVETANSPWIADLADKHPSITLSWSHVESVNSISLDVTPLASRPTEISITSPGGNRLDLSVPKAGGLISFPALTTDTMKVSFIRVAHKVTVLPAVPVQFTVPVGLQGVSIPALHVLPEAGLDLSKKISLPCGDGPDLTIDGQATTTSLTGTIGNLVDFQPLQFHACEPFGVLHMNSGDHSFEAKSGTQPFEVTSLIIQKAATSVAAKSPARRMATIGHWNSQFRTISVSAGPSTYLVVSQNFNRGWVATMDGHTLKAVRIDGWQQGYLVPAGQAGTVHLVMAPDRIFRLLLALGGLLVIGLIVLAFRKGKKRYPNAIGPISLPPKWILLVGTVVVLGLVAGRLGLVLVPMLLCGRWLGTRALALVAFGTFAAAGVMASLMPAALRSPTAGAFGKPAQILSVIALSAVLSALVITGRRFRGDRVPHTELSNAHLDRQNQDAAPVHAED
jgi:arabinofuranan 3-O-arabinosyltransferase